MQLLRPLPLVLLAAVPNLLLARQNFYDFNIERFTGAPDGVRRSIIGVNGQFPGPPIHVNKGDKLSIRVTNNLPAKDEGTALHAHGFFQRGTPWYDGVAGVTQCPIPPGKSFTYELDTKGQAGTTWYHAHFHTQYIDGFVGPLIIHDPKDPYRDQYDEEIVVMLSDWYHRESMDLLRNEFLTPKSKGDEPIPDSGLINGKGKYDCKKLHKSYGCDPHAKWSKFTFVKGKRYRLRIINMSGFAAFQFSIDGHMLQVIGADMTAVEKETVTRLNINVAQRYDVIVEADRAVDNYWMRATMVTACMPEHHEKLDPFVVANVHYKGAPNKDPTASITSPEPDEDQGCVDLDPHKLRPLQHSPIQLATKTVEITVDFTEDAHHVNVGIMNGVSYKPKWYDPILLHTLKGQSTFAQTQNVITLNKNEVVDLVVINKDDGEHPFHLHGHDFYVLEWAADKPYNPATVNLNLNNPILRDTSTLPKGGYTILRFKADNPGTWAFHCHIDWHQAAGLVVVFNELPKQQRHLKAPQSVKNLCGKQPSSYKHPSSKPPSSKPKYKKGVTSLVGSLVHL